MPGPARGAEGRSVLDAASALESPPEGDLIGVLQVGAHRQAGGEPGDGHGHGAQHAGEVGGGRLTDDVGGRWPG